MSELVLLCGDLTGGLEGVPVPCYGPRRMEVPKAKYINTNVLGSSTLTLEDTAIPIGCQCRGNCFDWSECTCFEGGKPYTHDGMLIPGVDVPVIECHGRCGCGEDCGNRVAQKGTRVRLKVVWSGPIGWSVVAMETIPRGMHVGEYAGQVVNTPEAQRRYRQYDTQGLNYLISLREHVGDRILRTNIDATPMGSVCRYINHSCDPNLDMHVVRMGYTIPHAMLYANRDISPGEHLSFSYGPSSAHGTKTCLCGTAHCKGYMPFDGGL